MEVQSTTGCRHSLRGPRGAIGSSSSRTRTRTNFLLLCEGGSSGGGGGGSHSNAGPGEGKDVVELTEANFRKKVINSDKVSLSSMPNPVCCGSGMFIPDFGSCFSSIPDPTTERGEGNNFVLPFFSHKFHKIEKYFIFERCIQIFCQSINK